MTDAPASPDAEGHSTGDDGLIGPGASVNQSAGAGPHAVLTERDRAILDFESGWSQRAAARRNGKDQAIRDTFSLSTTRYYQVLGALVTSRAALEYDPLLIKRLQRLREARQNARRERSSSLSAERPGSR